MLSGRLDERGGPHPLPGPAPDPEPGRSALQQVRALSPPPRRPEVPPSPCVTHDRPRILCAPPRSQDPAAKDHRGEDGRAWPNGRRHFRMVPVQLTLAMQLCSLESLPATDKYSARRPWRHDQHAAFLESYTRPPTQAPALPRDGVMPPPLPSPPRATGP